MVHMVHIKIRNNKTKFEPHLLLRARARKLRGPCGPCGPSLGFQGLQRSTQIVAMWTTRTFPLRETGLVDFFGLRSRTDCPHLAHNWAAAAVLPQSSLLSFAQRIVPVSGYMGIVNRHSPIQPVGPLLRKMRLDTPATAV